MGAALIAAFISVLVKQAADIAPHARVALLALMSSPALIIPYYLIALLTYPASASTDASALVADLFVTVGSWAVWVAYAVGAIGLIVIATKGLIKTFQSSEK